MSADLYTICGYGMSLSSLAGGAAAWLQKSSSVNMTFLFAATTNPTEVAAAITVIGGAAVGIFALGYGQIQKSRLESKRQWETESKEWLSPKYETALREIVALRAEVESLRKSEQTFREEIEGLRKLLFQVQVKYAQAQETLAKILADQVQESLHEDFLKEQSGP